jgi:hypothetical protein
MTQCLIEHHLEADTINSQFGEFSPNTPADYKTHPPNADIPIRDADRVQIIDESMDGTAAPND